MKLRQIRILTIGILLLTAGAAAPCAYAAKGWESGKTERTDSRHIAREGDVEIRAARDVIIVNTNHTVQIKVFTILGQMVSSETLGPGIHHFTVPAHGVYLIKVGDLTCKVAV